MIQIQKYALPDTELFENTTDSILAWIPDQTYVILGQRDNVENALEEENILVDDIPVMQRPTGGHSVVITPNTIVVSIVSFQSALTKVKQFFSNCNTIIIDALEQQGVKNLEIKGVSDIVLNGKKIVGSSMYRGKDFLFFHAVINISEPVETISRYLKHPESEPDYREGRVHNEFVSSLDAENYRIQIKKLILSIKKSKIN